MGNGRFYRWVGMIHNWKRAAALCGTDRRVCMLHRAVNGITFGFGLSDLRRRENCHVTYVGGHLIHMCEVEGNHGPQYRNTCPPQSFTVARVYKSSSLVVIIWVETSDRCQQRANHASVVL